MLNLGGLFFTLDADTRGLLNARRQVESFARTVDSAFKGLKQGAVGANVANGLLRQEKSIMGMLERVKALQDKINNSSIAPKASSNILKDLNAAYENFVRRMSTPVPLNSAQFSRNVAHMKSEIKDLEREYQKLNSGMASAQGFTNFSGVLRGMGGASLLIQGHLGGMSTRFFALTALVREFGVTAAVTAAGVAGLTAGVALLATTAVKAGKELQQVQVALTAVSGNAAVAGVHIRYVKDVAAQAGVVFSDTAKGYTRFLASAQAGGLTLQQTQAAFRGISLAAATMQLSVDDTAGVYRALDQMLSKGTVQAEELRGQLGDRLPGAFNIAAAAIGKTTAQLTKMMKDGDVIAADFVPKFVAAIQRMWNIDPNAPIQTLTASLNRLTNEWAYFGQELDKATGATRVFKAFLDTLTESLKAVSANLPQIISWVGALTGAFIGLGIAMAVNAVINYVASLGGLGATMSSLIAIIRGLVTGMIALNTVMLANPVLAVVRGIVILVGVLAGAKLGYDALTEAVSKNMASMNNTASIDAYIDAQKRMGFAVRSTTAAMIQQISVQAAQQVEAARSLATQTRQARAEYDQAVAARAKMGPVGGYRGAQGMVDAEVNRVTEKYTALRKQSEDAAKDIRATTRTVQGLREVLKLPEPPAVAVPKAGTAGKGGKSKELTDSINQVEDYVLRMQRAEERLSELSSGNRSYKLVDDLFKAREALNQLNPNQLSAVDKALQAAGFASGTLEERLGKVFTRTRQAEEAARTFNQVWDELEQGTINLTKLNKQLQFLRSGGDPRDMGSFEAMARAADMLRDIDVTSKAGQDALNGIKERFKELGIEVIDTGDSLEDTKNALAGFFNQEAKGDKLVSIFSDLYGEMEKSRDRLKELQALTNGIGGTGLDAIFGDPTQNEKTISAAVKRGQAVRDLIRDMTAAGASQEDINKKAQEYLDVLRQLDGAEDAYTRIRDNAQLARDSLREMANAGVDAFKDVVRGVSSVGEALLNLANNILDSLWQQYITVPFNNMLDNIGNKKAQKQGNAIDASIANTAQSGAVAEVSALGAAASMAAQAVNGNFTTAIAQGIVQLVSSTGAEIAKTAAVATSATAEARNFIATTLSTSAISAMGTAAAAAAVALQGVAAGGEGGEGNGIVGGVMKLVSLFGSASAAATGGRIVGPGSGTSDSIWAMIDGVKPLKVSNGESIVTAAATSKYWPLIDAMNRGTLPKLAGGGRVGGDSDYLLSSTSAYMSQNSPLTSSSNGSIMIDASTTIDARGATKETVQELKREMAARESRLMQQLPYLVDSRVRDSSMRGRYGG